MLDLVIPGVTGLPGSTGSAPRRPGNSAEEVKEPVTCCTWPPALCCAGRGEAGRGSGERGRDGEGLGGGGAESRGRRELGCTHHDPLTPTPAWAALLAEEASPWARGWASAGWESGSPRGQGSGGAHAGRRPHSSLTGSRRPSSWGPMKAWGGSRTLPSCFRLGLHLGEPLPCSPTAARRTDRHSPSSSCSRWILTPK